MPKIRFQFPAAKVRVKILAIALSTLVGVGLIGGIYLWQRSGLDALTNDERIAAEQSQALSEAEVLIGNARARLSELTLQPSQNAADAANAALSQLESHLSDYAFEPDVQAQLSDLPAKGRSILKAMTDLGLSENAGLTGALGVSVKAIEDVLNKQIDNGVNAWDSMAHLLMLRRDEKNFMARRTSEYVDAFNTDATALEKGIDGSWLTDKVKTALHDSLKSYHADFNNYATGLLAVGDGMSAFADAEKAGVALLTKKEAAYGDTAAARKTALNAKWDEFGFSILLVIAVAAIGSLALALAIGASIERPLSRLNGTMRQLADGDLEAEIGGLERRDEIGEMARTVEVFREHAIKVNALTEEEAERLDRSRDERAKMMQDLQRAFGEVVDAAITGDFSHRVEAEFPDAELNALARSVNDLVETVDRGMSESGEVLSALAHTDLTQRVTGSYEGAFERLKRNTNAVADKLVEIVTQLRETSRGLKTATGEILSGANDLSERTTKQAATIEETSAAMEQLAHTVMENAKKAGEASGQAKTASVTAEEGGEVMTKANQAMERISNSSAKISNIIGMIDDIAFQTNLLALNASVEAARAGEAGKGFAVVAVEVRRLAQSAAEASAEVKTLIEQSGEEVAGGTKLVASAAEKLSSMLEAVRANATQMEEIAKDSREQASAIEEVNVAVRQMDEMTQHNAALVEETNAAIEQTESQASDLDRIVDIFTLAEGGQQRPAAPAKTTAAPQSPAAKTYLSKGNAAVDQDWSEF